MKVQRKEYEELGRKYEEACRKVKQASDEMWALGSGAEKKVLHLWIAWDKARQEALEAATAEKRKELVDLRKQRDTAEQAFLAAEYECNHRDEEGRSTVEVVHGYGCEPDDKGYAQCKVCKEEWK